MERYYIPDYIKEFEKVRAREARAARLTDWMDRIPVVGQLTRVFWYLVLTEKDPRDGLMFSFLNDGHKPTLWHTWYSVTHDNNAPHSGIYSRGAPKNEGEARKYR